MTMIYKYVYNSTIIFEEWIFQGLTKTSASCNPNQLCPIEYCNQKLLCFLKSFLLWGLRIKRTYAFPCNT